MKAYLLLFVFFGLPTFASAESAFVSITFDRLVGKVEFRAPAEAVTGLKKPAISELQKKMQTESFDKFSSNVTKILVFPADLGCEFSQDHMETQEDGKIVDGSWNLQCKKDPKGHRVRFYFHKYFPRFKKIEAVSLNKGNQKSVVISKDGDSLELK